MRFKPVFTLTFIEHDLQGSQAEGHESQAYVVDMGLADSAATKIGGILNQPRGKQH